MLYILMKLDCACTDQLLDMAPHLQCRIPLAQLALRPTVYLSLPHHPLPNALQAPHYLLSHPQRHCQGTRHSRHLLNLSVLVFLQILRLVVCLLKASCSLVLGN